MVPRMSADGEQMDIPDGEDANPGVSSAAVGRRRADVGGDGKMARRDGMTMQGLSSNLRAPVVSDTSRAITMTSATIGTGWTS